METTKFEKYKELLKEVLQVDDHVAQMIVIEAGRLQGVSYLGRHPFLYHGLLALLTNFLYPFMGLKCKLKSVLKHDFIFVSCPDTIFRTKTIGRITGSLQYCIIYLPNFHVVSALRYHQYFKVEGIRAYFPTIRFSHIYRAWRMVSGIKKKSREITGDIEKRKLISALSQYLIYDGLVKDYLKQTDGFQGKWIVEHQIYYFIPVLANLHLQGNKTTMLQHGIFFKPSYNYFPMFCDKVLCCSEREKRIYVENGVAEESVIVFGAPLQTLQEGVEKSSKGKQYDLLVLLTIIRQENKELTRKVLSFIKKDYKNTLVRMRPRSRNEDIKQLGDVLDGFALSDLATSLTDDLSRCNKVVSFSEDANIEVAKSGRPFICVLQQDENETMADYKCANETNFEDEIRKLMGQAFYSTFTKEQYREILGETDVKVLREKFESYIKN